MKTPRHLTPILDDELNASDSYLAELIYRAGSAAPRHKIDTIYHWIN